MLPEPSVARQRVAERVAHGGHNIPVVDIERRFRRSLDNLFSHYLNAVDRTVCFLNETESPEGVFVKYGDNWTIHRQDVLNAMKRWVKHD